MMELRKIERFWTVFIHHEDGTVNDYRFTTKKAATDWMKQIRK